MSYRHVTIVSCLVLVFAFAAPQGASATLKCPNLPSGVKLEDVQSSWIALQLPIPNVTITCTDDKDTPTNPSDDVTKDYVKDVGAYIGGLYKYFVGVIGIIAAVMVFYGGLQWLTAGGNASRVKGAKETIFAALIAILIAFGSYTLLYTINPKLVVLNPPVLKVADTFLTSFDNTCPTTKVCLSGTNVGKTCTTDAACPGASIGACGLPIELNGDTTLTCGKRYTYKKILGVTTPSETCIGSYCEVKEYSTGGKEQLVCRSKKNFSNPPTEDDAVCTSPSLSCEDISKPSQSACSAASIPGEGKCRFVDRAFYNIINNDACVWNPPLACGNGYAQVGCGACNTLQISCNPGPFDSGLLEYILDNSNRVCDVMSSGEVAYTLDLAADGKSLRSICCQKKVCLGGPNPGQVCTDSTTCGTGTCGPDTSSMNKSDFQCAASKP